MRFMTPVHKAALRRSLMVTMAFGMLVAAARLTAQQPPQPGPEHEWLQEAVGTWDLTFKGDQGKGTATCKVGPGGLWVLDHVKADFVGMPFEGSGATSYDPTKKKFVNVWIDSMSTSPMVSEGTYDKAAKTLTLVGDMPMPDGKVVKATLTTVFKDRDNKTFSLSWPGPDGKVGEMMQITYKRRAK